MEFEEAHNNLRAIRLLYRLLHDNTLALQNANSEHLVERARILLKGLLDVAVESVFETHLKIIATEADISRTSFEQEKHMAVLQSKSPVTANNSRSSIKYPTYSKMTSQKDEQPHLKLLSKKEEPELSKFSISDNGGTNSKTIHSQGEENSMMQQNLVNVTNLSNEKGILPNTESCHHEQQYNNENSLHGVGEHAKESLQKFDAKAGQSNEDNNIPLLSATRLVESLHQKGGFSDDLVNVIKRIESRILALQLCSNLADSTKNSAGHLTIHKVANLDSPVIQRKDGTAGSQLSCGRSLFEGSRLMIQQTGKSSWKGENFISANASEEPFLAGNESLSQSQVPHQNHGLHTSAESAKSIDIPKQIGTQLVSGGEELRSRNRIRPSAQNVAMIDRVKSLNRLVSGDAHLGSQASECIQGLRVPVNQDDLSKKSSMLAGQANRKSLVRIRKNPVDWSKTDQNQKERSPESSYGQKLVGSTSSIIARREKPPPHQMVIRPTLLDQRSSEIKVFSHQHTDWSVLDRRGTHKTDHVEPWKTRVRPQHHELEESSSNSHSSSHWTSQQGSANSSSDSEDYSVPGGTQGPTSGRMVDATYEGSSEESSNSYPYEDDSLSRRVGSLKSYRYHRERNPEKTIGGLRRLKNKLGLIFHHHHHHHHHRHQDDDNGSIHSKAGHRHSMWNHLQNVFHHKNKHEALTKQKVEKTRRGAIARVVPRKNQVGQFHRLVEGLLRHSRHSKNPKPSKLGGVKGSRNNPHGHSQKKLRWWQILRRHQGVKLKDRSRVKMGFMSQKSLKN